MNSRRQLPVDTFFYDITLPTTTIQAPRDILAKDIRRVVSVSQLTKGTTMMNHLTI